MKFNLDIAIGVGILVIASIISMISQRPATSTDVYTAATAIGIVIRGYNR